MNLLALDPGTMAGMSDDHFIASIEPLLMTPLEKELFERFVYHSLNSEILDTVHEAGIYTVDELLTYMNRPECPREDKLDEPIDDALYLSGMFPEGSAAHTVAERLHKALTELQEDLICI